MEKEDFPGPKRAFLGEKHIIKQSMSPYSAYKKNPKTISQTKKLITPNI